MIDTGQVRVTGDTRWDVNAANRGRPQNLHHPSHQRVGQRPRSLNLGGSGAVLTKTQGGSAAVPCAALPRMSLSALRPSTISSGILQRTFSDPLEACLGALPLAQPLGIPHTVCPSLLIMLLEGRDRVSIVFGTPGPGPVSGCWTSLLAGSRSWAPLSNRTFCNDGDALYLCRPLQ